MLVALEEAHKERRTPEMELLRLAVRRIDLLWRQLVVTHGGEEPEPIEVLLPGEKPKKKSLRGVAAKAMAQMGGCGMAKLGTAENDVEGCRAKVRRVVETAGKEIEKGLGQAADKAAKEVEDKLSQFRGAAGLGITAGTTLLLKNATDSASSLAEAQGKARSVFADSYDEVQR